MHGHKNIKL